MRDLICKIQRNKNLKYIALQFICIDILIKLNCFSWCYNYLEQTCVTTPQTQPKESLMTDLVAFFSTIIVSNLTSMYLKMYTDSREKHKNSNEPI